MKKFITLFLVFSVIALSVPLTAKERKGADLIIQRTDGTQVRGELIAVKENSLLLMERDSGADATIDIGDISMIAIMKESNLMLGAGLGFIAGVGLGALGTTIGWELWSWAPHDTKTKYRIMAWVGAISGLVGALVGGEIGAHRSSFETIQFEGKSKSKTQRILKDLRKKVRIKNA